MNRILTKKIGGKKGFTLSELLIVIAIIAILMAIAIPVYASQMDKAERRVIQANLRSAVSISSADWLLTNGEPVKATGVEPEDDKKVTYTFTVGETGNLVLAVASAAEYTVKIADDGVCTSAVYTKGTKTITLNVADLDKEETDS